MTELFINGVSVVLPKDFSVQVKRENPFITKNGEYTYDLTLSLTNPVNANLYKHINRLNNTVEIESKRTAILIADNRVYCNGTEVITGWTESTVSIQVASGNSELNYFIGNDLQISSLEMKSSIEVDAKYITQRYPDIDYCLSPVLNRTNGHFINKWCRYGNNVVGYEYQEDDIYWSAQPFLCAYIKELLRAIGYDLIQNQLEETIYKDLFICHVVETNKWNEMLPGWSVKDFLEQIELLFNVVFVIDSRKKTTRLMSRNSFYNGIKSAHLQQVEDVFEVEVEEPEEEQHSQSNIKYNFPDNTYWRWNCIPDAISERMKHVDIPVDFKPDLTIWPRINAWFSDTENRATDTIYKDVKYDTEYIYSPGHPSYLMVNQYQRIKRDNTDKEITLDIMPVEFASAMVNFKGPNVEGGINTKEREMYMPVIDSESAQEVISEGNETITDLLNNGLETNSESSSHGNIFLAFFYALEVPVSLGGATPLKGIYPQPFTDTYIRNVSLPTMGYIQTNSNGANLRLSTFDGLFYNEPYDIDYTKGVKVNTYDMNIFDTRLVFEIRNKHYICKEMEFTLDAYGRKGAWSGTFYPIRVDDTPGLHWILENGRWRDFGLWLDDGQYIDV